MKIFFFAFLVIGAIGGIWFWRESAMPVEPVVPQEQKPKAIINGHELEIEIARTPDEHARGLSGRARLAENAGTLFVYEKSLVPGFWMKEMNFPIDIIWIDENKKIVGIYENIAPETFPEVFYPPSAVQYVLEVNANWAKTHNLSIGDEITFHGIF